MYETEFLIIILLIIILVCHNFNRVNYENFRFSFKSKKSSLPSFYKCPDEPSTYSKSHSTWLSCLVKKSLKLFHENQSDVSEEICKRLQSKSGSQMIEMFLISINCIGGYISCSKTSTASKNAEIFANILDHGIQSSGYKSRISLISNDKWSKIRDLFLTRIYKLMFKKYKYPGAILMVELYKINLDPKWLIDLILLDSVTKHIFYMLSKIPVSEIDLFKLETLYNVIRIGKSSRYNHKLSANHSFTTLLKYILTSPVIKDIVNDKTFSKPKKIMIIRMLHNFSPNEVQELDKNLYKKIDPNVNELFIKAFPNLKIPRKEIVIKS